MSEAIRSVPLKLGKIHFILEGIMFYTNEWPGTDKAILAGPSNGVCTCRYILEMTSSESFEAILMKLCRKHLLWTGIIIFTY